MAKKSKKSKKGKGASWLRTGMGIEDLQKELKKSGGSGDPEMLYIRDGDIVNMTIVTKPEDWVTFNQHFLGGKAGYRICTEDGCLYCDDGLGTSQRTMIGVYINHYAQAASGDWKAKRTKDLGYRFVQLNKETTETLLRIARRRGGKLNDYIYTIERIGSDTSTKYDLERSDKPSKKKHVRGWNKNIVKKLRSMQAKEDDTGIDDDDDDDDDDDYDYEKPKNKRKKSSAKKEKKRKSVKRNKRSRS